MEGPLSNLKPSRSNEWAQPPAIVWLSHTVTFKPYWMPSVVVCARVNGRSNQRGDAERAREPAIIGAD